MKAKDNFWFYIMAFLLLLGLVPPAMAFTVDELADICEEMEFAIVDISLEYEWYNIPPWTIEEVEREMGMEMLVHKDGLRRFKLSAAGLLSNTDPNDPNSSLPDRLLLETSTTIMDKRGNTWDEVTRASYDGKIAKYLQIGGWPREVRTGGISYKKRFFMLPVNLTPIGFSVLRFRFSKVTDSKSLPFVLRKLGRLDNNIEKINGFNTIRADLLQEWTKQVCIRVYFSVDHGYTPVKYEFMRGGKPDLTIEVHSLEQVAEGLWFPSSGVINCTDSERVDAYQATSKVLVNQGLTEKDFDIKFPPGTKVHDEIKDLEYVVKAE